MYKILYENGTVAAHRVAKFLREQDNGYTVACPMEDADALVVDGKTFALRGHDFRGLPSVNVIEEEDDPYEVPRNAANIDYLSMMTGIDLPQGGV